MSAVTARRGDLVVYERKTSYTTSSAGYQQTTEYEVGVVAHVKRDGTVKGIRGRYGDGSSGLPFGYQRCWLVDQAEIDVEAACTAAWANEWSPGKPGRPFDSLEAVSATVRPFRVQA